jgi:ATP-binding cassette subfamily C protein CydC
MSVFFSLFCWFSSASLMAIAGYLIARAAEQPEMAALSLFVVGVRFFGISRGAFRYAERLSSHSLAFRELKKFRLHLYKILEPLVPYKLSAVSESEMLERISADAEEYKSWMPRAGVLFFAGLGSIAISVCVFAYFHLHYAFCFLAVSFLLFGISIASFFSIKKRAKEWGISGDEFREFSLSVAQGMAEKKSWGIFGKISKTWDTLGCVEEKKRKKVYSIYCLAEIFSAVSPFLCLAGIFFTGAGNFSFPVWIGILLYTLAAFELLQELPFIALQSALSLNAGGRVNALNTPRQAAPATPLGEGNFFCGEGNFCQQTLVLNRGDALILSAPSGAGKTLLANSIAGFLPNSELLERTSNFVFLEQEPFLFTGTIRDNLLFVAPSATDGEMQSVLQKAGLEKFSLDLWIGERGFALSGGERQKLSAARAMLCNAELIIADEPAAHLPAKDERKLFDEFINLPVKPAVLWFSHTQSLLASSNNSCT